MAHGPNVISCVLISGDRHWNIIGAYIPPTETDGETIQFINEAVQYHGTTNPYILLGNLNINLDNNHDARADDIISQIVLLALDDVGNHFPHPCGHWTWSQCHNNCYYRSQMDYILAQDTHAFS